ncbi:MAG: DUF3987 domain-containing protein [Saprospiraceae bacterium]|nr:DUF3987 domain-containing protein [Saprospiraceae bacterium]
MKLFNALKNDTKNGQSYTAEDIATLARQAIKNDDTQPNPFPIKAFPKPLQAIIRHWHAVYRRPIDYHGGSILAAASGAIGNAFQVEHVVGDVEPMSLWIVIVGPPSSAKSPIMRTCLKPLFKKEKEYSKQHKEDIIAWQRKRDNAESKDRRKMEDQRPIRPQRIVGDATIESLIKIFPNNWKGVLSFKDEFIALMKGMNAYKSAGQDLEHFLSMWSGTPIMLNRSSLEDAVFIESPFISILGAIQPGILSGLTDANKISNGFLFRLLFCAPQSVKIPKPSQEVPNPEYFEEYNKIIQRLNELPTAPDFTPTILKMDAKGFRRYADYKTNIEQNIMNETEDENIKSLYGKILAYTLRLAGILELIELATMSDDGYWENLSYADISHHKISLSSVNRAILLTHYFTENSLRILAQSENPVAALPRKQYWIYEKLPQVCSSSLAVQVAQKMGIGEKTARRLIYNKKLFAQNKDGTYRKLYS